MSFRAVILLKSREAVTIRANATKTHFKFGSGLYIITEKDIQNVEIKGKIKGAEAIYFEGNPNAIGYKKIEDTQADKSATYLNEIVRLNALRQTGSRAKFQLGEWLNYLAPLKDPVNLVYILFALAIAYGLIAGGLGWV